MGRRFGRDDPPYEKLLTFKHPVIGAVIQTEYWITDHESFTHWQLTDDMDDLLLSKHEFVSGSNIKECAAALERQFPCKVPGFSRVSIHAVDEPKRNAQHILVFSGPFQPSEGLWPNFPSIEKATLAGHKIIISTEDAENLRGSERFDNADLVITTGEKKFSVIRYDPARKAAIAKGQKTRTDNEKRAAELARMAQDMVKSIAYAYSNVRDQFFSVTAIGRTISPVIAVGDPAYKCEWRRRQQVIILNRGALMDLITLTWLHEKCFGPKQYRLRPGFQKMLKTFRELPKDLKYDAWCSDENAYNWLVAEAKARLPKPKQPKPVRAGVTEEID